MAVGDKSGIVGLFDPTGEVRSVSGPWPRDSVPWTTRSWGSWMTAWAIRTSF